MFMTTRRRLLAPAMGLVLAAGVAVQLSGQQRRFISGVNLRTVDFNITGPDGLPITDLKPEEVQLKLDGKTRKVAGLELIPVAGAAAPGVAAKPILPQPFASNSGADAGRVIIIAVDDESFRVGRERPMKTAVSTFLDKLSPRDLVGLVTMPHGGWKAHPTTDRARIKEEMAKIIGHAAQSESADESTCRTRTVLEVLTTMLQQMGAAGTPPTVLFFSSKLSGPTGIKPITSGQNIAGCELPPLTFSRVGYAAGEARAHFYVIQPDDEPVSSQSLEGLENVAGVTGGTRLAIAANGDTTLDRVLRETTSYYMIGFEPEDSDNNGMSHSVDVKVTRAGAKVRSRPEVMLPKLGFGAQITTYTPREMLRETKVFRDLEIRSLAYTSRHDDKTVKVLAAAEAADPSIKIQEMEAAIFDPQGKMIAGVVADATSLSRSPVMTAMVVPPGRYRLRVATRDASGRSGTADQEILAELAPVGTSPLKLSSLVLGLSRGGDILPRMQFGTEPVAVTFLEMYGGQKGQEVAAWLELAQSMEGGPFLIVPLVVEGTSEADKFKAMGAVPVGGLPAGDILVRARVQFGKDGPVGEVTRTIRKIG
jgi:VWFA-related protein